MTLENAKSFPKDIILPKLLVNKINTFTNCEVLEREVDIYNLALSGIAKHLAQENTDLCLLYTLNVFFTNDGSISFSERSEENCGSQFHVAIYRLQKLRGFNDERLMLFIFLEELVHYFWRIFDETLVKYKVEEIIQYLIPEFKLDDLRGYKLNGL